MVYSSAQPGVSRCQAGSPGPSTRTSKLPARKSHKAFIGLLAIRLAYDCAVGQALGLAIDWNSYMRNGYASFQGEEGVQLQHAWMRYTLLRATEIRYRRHLLGALTTEAATKSKTTTRRWCFVSTSARNACVATSRACTLGRNLRLRRFLWLTDRVLAAWRNPDHTSIACVVEATTLHPRVLVQSIARRSIAGNAATRRRALVAQTVAEL